VRVPNIMLIVLVGASPAGCEALSPRGSRPPDGAATARSDAGLAGKWKVLVEEKRGRRREIPPHASWTMEFLKGGKLTYCKRTCKDGTWTVKGDRLTTSIQGQTRTVTFTLAGDKLTVVSGESAEWRLHLERVRPPS